MKNKTKDGFFSSINERVLCIIDNQCNKNKIKFAKTIGFAPQVIYNIVSGRKSKPSFDVLNAIISSFDDINPVWLMTGHGNMLRAGEDRSAASPCISMTDKSDPLASCRSEVDRLHGLLSEKDRQIASLLEQQEKLIGKLTE